MTVREILTAKLTTRNNEPLTATLNPTPVAYYLAKESKPENLAGGAARVFLGVRLECAQCHNHPFAQWKREQFWGFAAFFAGVPRQQPPEEEAQVVRPRDKDAPPLRELTIPGTKKIVKATHLDGSAPLWRPRADTREILAEWVTSPENPYFARAIVNRVWARFLGLGLVEPVDDLEADDGSEFSELLDEVATQFRAHGLVTLAHRRSASSPRPGRTTSRAALRPFGIGQSHVHLDAGPWPLSPASFSRA